MIVAFAHERAAVLHGDSTGLAEFLPENSVDAIVTDPPASIGFMGQKWDDDRGGFDHWTRWLAGVLAPSVRALKPGGHALIWALPRTSHWTARAVELAGLEIRDMHHDIVSADEVFADLADALDDKQRAAVARAFECLGAPILYQAFSTGFPKSLTSKSADIPEWAGTALKPAVEHWILARKPLDGSVAENYAKWGTGVLNIDGCRIGNEPRINPPAGNKAGQGTSYMMAVHGMPSDAQPTTTTGRWPAHLSLRHAPDCVFLGEAEDKITTYENAGDTDREGNGTNFAMGIQRVDGTKVVSRGVYRCVPGCPVAEIDAQSGISKSTKAAKNKRRSQGFATGTPTTDDRLVGHHDKGGASRFYYCAKASRKEKDAGLAHLPARTGGEATGREDDSAGVGNPRAGAGRTGGAHNHHPTCKAVSLMKWLITLISPPGGTVLDPFAGSGTTGVAALDLGMKFIGAEQGGDDGEYIPILVGRIRHALNLPPEQPDESKG